MINFRPIPASKGRRDGEVHEFEFAGIAFAVTINFDLTTRQAYEVFLSTQKHEGSLMTAILSDACIAISKLMEAGASASDLVGMFGINRYEGISAAEAKPSSPLGLIVRRAMEREAELRAEAA